MSDTLNQWHYFVSPIYTINKPEFLGITRKLSNAVLSNATPVLQDDIYPVIQEGIPENPALIPFQEYVLNTAWNLLQDQGYDLSNIETYFTQFWAQEHKKYSSHEYHIHNDSKLVAFYILESADQPRLIIHDPRPGKVMCSLQETDVNNLTMASDSVNFKLEPGMLLFANSWLPHSITRNPNNKSFKLIHMNISTRLHNTNINFPDTAEIV